jgi:hypothetical protein
MQDVGIATSRTAMVTRPERSPRVYIEFRGTSDARSKTDRDTRLRITLPASHAAALWHALGAQLTDDGKAQSGV